MTPKQKIIRCLSVASRSWVLLAVVAITVVGSAGWGNAVLAQRQFGISDSTAGLTETGAAATPLSTRAGRTSETGAADARLANAQDDAYYEQYENQLNAVLKTRRDEEKEFLSAVVEQIRQGNLTTRVVNTSFKWVNKKRPDVRYPFVYFERVLRLLAQKQGAAAALPAFDSGIYSRRPVSAQQGRSTLTR